jgi:hypothetical protein
MFYNLNKCINVIKSNLWTDELNCFSVVSFSASCIMFADKAAEPYIQILKSAKSVKDIRSSLFIVSFSDIE